jgi:hypothetical protein
MINWLKINFYQKKTGIWIILCIGFLLRVFWLYKGQAASTYTLIDEVKAYIWSYNLHYFSHARFFSYVPGPWQNVIGFISLSVFNTVYGFYIFWLLISTVQIYLMYNLACKVGNHQQAVLAAIITAVFPWPIEYTMKFWNPLFVIPLMTLLFGILFDVIHKNKSKKIFFIILLYSIMPFFHMMSAFTFPGFLLIVILYRKNINFSYMFLGGVCGLLFYIPFIYYDRINGFFMFKGYLAGSNDNSVFKPESLKVISNSIIVISHEVSRFIGHSSKEFFHFLNKYYGHFSIGILFIASSIGVAISAWIHFFKNINKENNTFYKVTALFIISNAVLFFILTKSAHEFRYTNVWWPLLYLLLVKFIYAVLQKIGSYSKTKKRIALIVSGLYFLNGIYLSFCIPLYHSNPNYKKTYRHIPSLVTFEKIEHAVLKAAGKRIYPEPKKYPVFYDSELKPFAISNTLWSTVHQTSDQKAVSLYIDQSYIDKELAPNKINIFNWLLGMYIRYRGYITLVSDPSKAGIIISFISKEMYKKQSGFQWRILKKLSNGYILIK